MPQAMSLETKVFNETQGAIVRNEYSRPEGRRKFLADRAVQEDVDYYSAEEVEELIDNVEQFADKLGDAAVISVSDDDTLVTALDIQAARTDDDAKPVLVLNFACAFMAGGNEAIGKHAQEGELCRRSTLFASISVEEAHPFYDANNDLGGSLYTNGVLVSPHVEVFREPGYLTMETPVVVSVISSPAPYAVTMKGVTEEELFDVLKTRIQGILAVAAQNGYRHLVLGAWGCDSNGNDPAMVARAFHEALDTPLAGATFANLFTTVAFAVADTKKGQPNLVAFKSEFGM
ncbi:MAG: TIGR02452 family protein [Eggerthellaceae bacterium]|nr:TIGR02452 family protein [Eggerthellaceae bacterium]